MTTRQPFWRLAKGTIVYGVGGFLSRFVSFMLLPVFTAYLTPEDFGISAILGFIGFLLTPVFSLGLGAAMGICYFKEDDKLRKEMTVWTSFTMLGMSVAVLACLGSILSPEISVLVFRSDGYRHLVMLSILGSCLNILSTPFMLYFQFEERAKTFVFLTTLSTLIGIGLNILMVVVLGRGVQGWVESGLMAQAATLVLFLFPALLITRYQFSRTLSLEILKLGVPLIPSFAFLFIIHHGNKYILQWFEGLEAVGIYTVGFNIGLTMSLIVSGFTSAWMPYFLSFSNKWEEARILFGRILTYYVLLFGGVSLLFYLAARPISMIMTTVAFHEAYKVVGLSATAQFCSGLYSIFLPAIYFAKEVRYVTLIQGMAALLAVAFNLVLVPMLGLTGSGISLMLGMSGMCILQQLWNFKKRWFYLNVRYEWVRIFWFSLFYSGYILILLLKPNFSLTMELLISGLAAATVPLLIYGFLNDVERKTVERIGKQLGGKITAYLSFYRGAKRW